MASMYLNEKANKQAKEIEKNLEPVKEIMEDKGTLVGIDLTRELHIADEVEVILGDYEFVLKDGKAYFVKKKPKYPKTYRECCDILDVEPYSRSAGYKSDLITAFRNLLICRDAYWMIAGEEMGLGKPWECDGTNGYHTHAIIYRGGFIQKVEICTRNAILAFPTAEMRDAFYESFKDLIDACKELL